jgi:hypothetical protein
MAGKVVEYEATISRVERMRNLSKNGNPSYEIVFADGTSARTEIDGSIGYEIANPEWEGARVKVKAHASGRVWAVEHV